MQSLLERSYSKCLQSNDGKDFCEDRLQALKQSKAIKNVDLKVRALVQYSFCFKNDKEKFAYAMSLLYQAKSLGRNVVVLGNAD